MTLSKQWPVGGDAVGIGLDEADEAVESWIGEITLDSLKILLKISLSSGVMGRPAKLATVLRASFNNVITAILSLFSLLISTFKLSHFKFLNTSFQDCLSSSSGLNDLTLPIDAKSFLTAASSMSCVKGEGVEPFITSSGFIVNTFRAVRLLYFLTASLGTYMESI